VSISAAVGGWAGANRKESSSDPRPFFRSTSRPRGAVRFAYNRGQWVDYFYQPNLATGQAAALFTSKGVGAFRDPAIQCRLGAALFRHPERSDSNAAESKRHDLALTTRSQKHKTLRTALTSLPGINPRPVFRRMHTNRHLAKGRPSGIITGRSRQLQTAAHAVIPVKK